MHVVVYLHTNDNSHNVRRTQTPEVWEMCVLVRTFNSLPKHLLRFVCLST